MRYIPATPDEVRTMLSAIGQESIDALFDVIPEAYRLKRALQVPAPLSEWELMTHLQEMASSSHGHRHTSFLGGGAYSHITSSVVDTLISRSEFSTAYTPYQPEVSQGTLQAIFEFQSYVCELFGMDVANASVYEIASGLAEACLMSERITKKSPRRLLISAAVNPQYRQVVQTYLKSTGIEILEVPVASDGATHQEALATLAKGGALAVVLQTPNYFGVIEDLRAARDIATRSQAALMVAVSEPVSMGVLAPPGKFGADVVVSEGQSFGIPLSFGGPYVGLFASKQEHVRALPGRLVGRTVDADQRDGFVLTLATREQHIRRDKATSNICTNQGLCALSAAIFLSLVGKQGLAELARHNLSKATWLKRKIGELESFDLPYSGATFNEFVVRSKAVPVPELMKRLEARGVLAGIPLGGEYPELADCFLLTVTEVATRQALERLFTLLEEEGRA